METNAQEFESKSILIDHLERSRIPHLIVGLQAEAPREFYVYDIASPAGRRFKLGIISSGHGCRPASLLSASGTNLAVGSDQTVSFIDAQAIKLLRAQRTDGAFFEFIPTRLPERFTVLHELGAAQFSLSGERLWSVSTGVVESWAEGPNGLLVIRETESRKRTAIDLTTTGARLSLKEKI